MERIEQSKETFKQLFGEGVPATYTTDPDLQDILSHFIFGEVFHKELAYQATGVDHAGGAGNQSDTASTPSAHARCVEHRARLRSKSKRPSTNAHRTLVSQKRSMPSPRSTRRSKPEASHCRSRAKSRWKRTTGYDKGLAVRQEIFGDIVVKHWEDAPSDQKHLQEYLSSFCFGDHTLPSLHGFPENAERFAMHQRNDSRRSLENRLTSSQLQVVK